MPISVAAMFGLLVGLAHFLITRPGERPGLDFVMLAAIAEFWLAAILAGALIMAPKLHGPWVVALGTTVVIWIGFIVPVLMVTLRFRSMPGHMAAADSLHWLATMLVQMVVMMLLGLTAPPM